jgi:hypothetical protein
MGSAMLHPGFRRAGMLYVAIGIIGAKRNAKNNTTFKTAYDEKSVMHYSHGKYNYSTYEKPSDGDIEMAILVNDAFADRDGKLLDGK